MLTLALEGMRFYAYLGFYEEEQVVCNEYQVDVYLEAIVLKHGDAPLPEDDIQTTISYETIYHICKLEMKKPVRLLETLAQRILEPVGRIGHRGSTSLSRRAKICTCAGK